MKLQKRAGKIILSLVLAGSLAGATALPSSAMSQATLRYIDASNRALMNAGEENDVLQYAVRLENVYYGKQVTSVSRSEMEYKGLLHDIQVNVDDPATISYACDALGNVTAEARTLPGDDNTTSVTTAYAYDGLNHLTAMVEQGQENVVVHTYTNTYDGNLLTKSADQTLTRPDDTNRFQGVLTQCEKDYAYDQYGRISSIKVPLMDYEGLQHDYRYTYKNNRLIRIRDAVSSFSQAAVTFAYDANNRLVSAEETTTDNGRVGKVDYTFTWNADGTLATMVKEKETLLGQKASVTYTFAY